MSEKATCQLCGEPMPPGEEMFNYHGYSGPCPKEPLPAKPTALQLAFIGGAQACREMMARFVACENESTAASIRANWNPKWGPDPGKLEGDIPKLEAVQ